MEGNPNTRVQREARERERVGEREKICNVYAACYMIS